MTKEYWAIHTNPLIWDSVRELESRSVGKFKINKKDRYEIKTGQKGILWVSGKSSGVYSLITVIREPYIGEFEQSDIEFMVDPTKFIGQYILINVKYEKIKKIIPRRVLLNNSILKHNYGFVNAQGQCDFLLLSREYQEIIKLLKS